jgi:hypothetical protein
MMLQRIGKFGQIYTLHDNGDGTTLIRTGKKLLEVAQPLERLNQAWFFWQSGERIQDAFSFLSPEEREFILTGITPAEWKKMFSEEDV